MLQKNRLNIQRYCTSSLFYLCSVYSLLNASIGFKFAAFTEGSSPNTTPITVENNTAITIDGTLIAVGEPVTFPTTFDSPIPVITPIIPPILVSTEASVRNCPRIVFLHDIHDTNTTHKERNTCNPDQLIICTLTELLHILNLLHDIFSFVFHGCISTCIQGCN